MWSVVGAAAAADWSVRILLASDWSVFGVWSVKVLMRSSPDWSEVIPSSRRAASVLCVSVVRFTFDAIGRFKYSLLSNWPITIVFRDGLDLKLGALIFFLSSRSTGKNMVLD